MVFVRTGVHIDRFAAGVEN